MSTFKERLAYDLHHIARHNAGFQGPFVQDSSVQHHAEEDAFSRVAIAGNARYTNDQQEFPLEAVNYQYASPQLLASESPRSHTESNGKTRTRSGRVIRRRDSPMSTTRDNSGRVSKASTSKRTKAGNANKKKGPSIEAPLSELTKDSDVPVKDIEAWVNRPAQTRMEESQKRNGHIARPMNSFMLYRSAYAERTKDWAKQNNHQIVSSVAGESWPMEPPEVREQFNDWAKLERDNHSRAFPNYKFSPSKANIRKRDDDEEDDDLNSVDDPDADWIPSRTSRSKQSRARSEEVAQPNSSPYAADPYRYGHDGRSYHLWSSQPRPLPAAYGYTGNGERAYYRVVPSQDPYRHLEQVRMQASPSPLSGYGASSFAGVPIGLPSNRLIDHALPAPSSSPYYHTQESESIPTSNYIHYAGHAVHPGMLSMQSAELSQFDDAYDSHPEFDEYQLADPSWSSLTLDPSLLGPLEGDASYGQLFNHTQT